APRRLPVGPGCAGGGRASCRREIGRERGRRAARRSAAGGRVSSAAPASPVQSVAGFRGGAEGVTPPRGPEGTGRLRSDVIADLGFVDRETVERAVETARQPGRMVDRILLENGDLTEENLSRALAERYGLDHVDLGRFRVDMSAAGLVSRTAAL